MKVFNILVVILFVVSCAHTPDSELNNRIAKYNGKSHAEIKDDVEYLLDHHPEFDGETKLKIKEILISSLEENSRLKTKESKLAQHLIQLTLVDKASYKEIVSLRKQMTANYKEKIKLFEKTAVGLKKVIGIKKEQNRNKFIGETGAFFR